MSNSEIIVILIIVFLSIGIFLAFRRLYSFWKTASFLVSIIQELIEYVPFFKLLGILFGKSHTMERHSPLTKLPEHINRAKFGLTPEGIQLQPVHSGKWLSYYYMLHAIDCSIQAWKIEKINQKKVYFYKFDKSVGIVVKKNSSDVVSTSKTIVVISKKGDVVTAYPVLEEETENPLNINLKTLTFQEYNELYLTSD